MSILSGLVFSILMPPISWLAEHLKTKERTIIVPLLFASDGGFRILSSLLEYNYQTEKDFAVNLLF